MTVLVILSIIILLMVFILIDLYFFTHKNLPVTLLLLRITVLFEIVGTLNRLIFTELKTLYVLRKMQSFSYSKGEKYSWILVSKATCDDEQCWVNHCFPPLALYHKIITSQEVGADINVSCCSSIQIKSPKNTKLSS